MGGTAPPSLPPVTEGPRTAHQRPLLLGGSAAASYTRFFVFADKCMCGCKIHSEMMIMTPCLAGRA